MTTSKITQSELTGRSLINHADIKFKHIYAIIVWTIDMTEVAYYILFTNEGYPLGKVKHLRYIESASKTKI